MKKEQLSRRAMLRGATLGVGGLVAMEYLGGVPLLGSWTSRHIINPMYHRLDAFHMIPQVLRGGPALLDVHRAMAQGDTGWSLVTIKVLDHVYAPICFALGQTTAGSTTVTTDSSVPANTAATTTCTSTLVGLGAGKLSDNPKYAALRFNMWFANMMHNGTTDGTAANGTNSLGLASNAVAPIDPDKVAIQVGMYMGKNNTAHNHSLAGTKLSDDLADLSYYADQNKLISSPLGISCFMMGGTYQNAEGVSTTNAVLGPAQGATVEIPMVASHTVTQYANQISQYVGNSYADHSPIEQNLTYNLDQLVDKNPTMRASMLDTLSSFQQSLTAIQAAGILEATMQTFDATTANGQSNVPGNGASQEFLGQCLYVANALEIPGTPLRNFSLFLNANDLNGENMDLVSFGSGAFPNTGRQPYTYIEAMRQLAMGLNVLSKKIAEGHNLIVAVVSEGGRGNDMADNDRSFGMIFGPKGSGLLTDALYTNMAGINATNGTYLTNPADAGTNVTWDTPGLCNGDGSAATGAAQVGQFQMGIVEFLEGATGTANTRTALTGSDAMYVKLARG